MQCFNKEDVRALEQLKRQSWGATAQERELYRTITFPKHRAAGTEMPGATWCWIHQQGLQKRPGLWKACPHTFMQDGTEAKLGNYTSHVHSVKNNSNEEQWLILIQIRFNTLPPRDGVYPYRSQSNWAL